MAHASVLSDDMVRQLVAVGQVDVLVGVPTFNNAASIEAIVRTLHVGLARHFPRERTVLVNPDGGSDDGTPDLVRSARMADEEMRGSTTLRTTHRVSAASPGIPGLSSGVHAVFAAADLLQAQVVVLIDADVTSMTPDWVGELARPIQRNEADLVLPIHPRHRLHGPLLNQLVRPLLGTAYGRRLHSSLAGNYGCSGRFVSRMLGEDVWKRDLARPALDVWLLATAMSEELRLFQTHLGPCTTTPRATRSALPWLFEQVVGTAFDCLGEHAATWLPRDEALDLPTGGTPLPSTDTEPALDPAPMAERFRTGVRDLAPLLREILTPGTLARLQAAAAPGEDPIRIPDPLWVTTVYEFAAGAHRGIMRRGHLTQALVPIYLGRAASFFMEVAAADAAAHSRRLAELEHVYEELRPALVELWNTEGRR